MPGTKRNLDPLGGMMRAAFVGDLGCMNSGSLETSAAAGEIPRGLVRHSSAFTNNGKDFGQNSTDAKARPLQTRGGPGDKKRPGRRSPNGPAGQFLLANPCKSEHLQEIAWLTSW